MRMKNDRKTLERIVRGFSNHRRIEILALLRKSPKLSVQQVSEEVRADYRTIADHLRRLALAGLVAKRNQGPSVQHTLTDRGSRVLNFLSSLD
jgi:DNA-binding transcriptional ArsR family regulator